MLAPLTCTREQPDLGLRKSVYFSPELKHHDGLLLLLNGLRVHKKTNPSGVMAHVSEVLQGITFEATSRAKALDCLNKLATWTLGPLLSAQEVSMICMLVDMVTVSSNQLSATKVEPEDLESKPTLDLAGERNKERAEPVCPAQACCTIVHVNRMP